MENVKKFYEALKSDKAMQERANALNENKPEDEDEIMAVIVTFATKEGHMITIADLKAYHEANAKVEVSDDDMDAVAGGLYDPSTCFCVVGGGGTDEASGAVCACVAVGMGESDEKWDALVCIVAGAVG